MTVHEESIRATSPHAWAPFPADVGSYIESTPWTFAKTYAAAGLINRCGEDQTYEARLAAGTLPGR